MRFAWIGRFVGALLCAAVASSLAASPDGATVDRGFLWRIERDGHTSTLYGTLHVGKAAWLPPGPRVVAALDAADTVAVEIDLLDPAMQRRIAASAAPNPGQRLPPVLAERLHARLRDAGVDPAAAAALAPELQATMLVMLAARADGLDPRHGADVFVAAAAHAADKPVISLETPEAQVALLTGDPRRGRRIVEKTLEQLDDGRAGRVLRRTAEAWAESRYDDLAGYRDWCDCVQDADDRALLKRLLDDRNVALAARIDALHASGKRVFAAVGSLHLIGRAGLPALLAAQGFTVERVAFDR